MESWEEQVVQDARAIVDFLRSEYRGGKRTPLSVTRLASRLRRSRDRVTAAVTYLVFVTREIGAVGPSATRTNYYPMNE